MRGTRMAFFVILALAATTISNPAAARERESKKLNQSVGLNAGDFEKAAESAATSLIQSGMIDRPGGGRYVLVIARIVNDTMQRIDTDQLIKKIRVALTKSGRVAITTAVGLEGAEDEMTYAARELRGDSEFDQQGVAGKGQLQAPDLSLSGKIIQRNNTVNRRTQQIDYYFQLTLTDINTGLSIWEDEYPISKLASSKSAAW
jgi:penicillin-binding protein activator